MQPWWANENIKKPESTTNSWTVVDDRETFSKSKWNFMLNNNMKKYFIWHFSYSADIHTDVRFLSQKTKGVWSTITSLTASL